MNYEAHLNIIKQRRWDKWGVETFFQDSGRYNSLKPFLASSSLYNSRLYIQLIYYQLLTIINIFAEILYKWGSNIFSSVWGGSNIFGISSIDSFSFLLLCPYDCTIFWFIYLVRRGDITAYKWYRGQMCILEDIEMLALWDLCHIADEELLLFTWRWDEQVYEWKWYKCGKRCPNSKF